MPPLVKVTQVILRQEERGRAQRGPLPQCGLARQSRPQCLPRHPLPSDPSAADSLRGLHLWSMDLQGRKIQRKFRGPMELDGEKFHLYFYSLRLRLSVSFDCEPDKELRLYQQTLGSCGCPEIFMPHGRSGITKISHMLITAPKS